MFHSRRINNKINFIHETTLRITYQDHICKFQALLNKDISVSIHYENLQVLATKMFKIHRGMSPDILRETFVPKMTSFNLRRNNTFERRQFHSVYHGNKSLYPFLVKRFGFSTIGTETIGKPRRLQIENKEMDSL